MRVRNRLILRTGAAAATALLISSAAYAAAQEPSISGDRWVALAIIGGLVRVVLLFVFASVGVARRDAAAQRGRKSDDDGLPIFGGDDD
jgi:hypothetical protein